MAAHPDFPKSSHSILSPDIRWFPADEALRKKVKEWRDTGYAGASDTSKALLKLVVQDGTSTAQIWL